MSPFLEKHAHSSMWKSPVTKECHLQNFLHHTLEEGGEGESSLEGKLHILKKPNTNSLLSRNG